MISENNKRIAKNTLFLYVRMLFTMAVTLYTSRVILQVLGVEDYGIYNVVGGVIMMFSFINGGMISATQRYLTYDIGQGNKEHLQSVFTTALQIHGIIAFIIIILGESIGLWFIYTQMVIPESRFSAAIWVYQFSILTAVINIMSVPYNSDIIAHEKMSAFAYISIVEVVLKLLIVYALTIFSYDKLILYALLVFVVQLMIRIVYTIYCHRHFEESKYSSKFNKVLFKEMSCFAIWSFWGNLASVLYTQGLNMILNVFFGPIVNAARGIAVQVQSAVQQFVGNFQMALNPQITKSFAIGDVDQMHSLMFRSARFSFFLLYLITLPVLLETEFLLNLWLKDVPENTVVFTQIMICISLIYTISNPCVVANQATGDVRNYQIIIGGILLTILPISFICLKCGAPAYSVFLVHFIIESLAQVFRMLLLRKQINLSIKSYIKNIYFPITLVICVSTVLPLILFKSLPYGICRFILVAIISVLSVSFSTLFLGLTKNEREFILSKGLSRIKTLFN